MLEGTKRKVFLGLLNDNLQLHRLCGIEWHGYWD
jgi:hypothetical protein